MNSFVVSLDLSAVEKYNSESEPYNLLVDTRKMKTVKEFILWLRHLFSINDPIVLLYGDTETNFSENIQVLSSRRKLIVKPTTSVNNSIAELTVSKKECKETLVSPPERENVAVGVHNPEAVVPLNDKDKGIDGSQLNKVPMGKKDVNKKSNCKTSEDRFVYVSHSLYKNGKLNDIVKEIDVKSHSSYPLYESKDLLYRCYSKSLNSLNWHKRMHSNPQIIPCNTLNDENKPVNEVQSNTNKTDSEVSVKPTNTASKTRDVTPNSEPTNKQKQEPQVIKPVTNIQVEHIENQRGCLNIF